MEDCDLGLDNIDAFQDEVSNYNTDSDIDDPKYTPTYSTIHKDKYHSLNHSNIAKSLEEKLRCLKHENNSKTITIGDYEQKISDYAVELNKVKDKLAAKESILTEFQVLSAQSATKFKLLEAKNEQLVKANENLMKKLTEYEKDNKLLKDYALENESLKKKIEKLQNEAEKKEEVLRNKYEEKEENIKTEYLLEITKLTKEIEELRVNNEKQKFEISNLKMNLTNISSNHESKQNEAIDLLTKKEKEITLLQDKIKEYDTQIKATANTIKEKEESIKKEIQKVKEDNNSLMNELNQKSNIIEELEADIEGLNQKVERLSNEIQENSTTITNKDVIINQIKNQNENLQKDIEDKEKEMELIEKTRQKEVNEYKEQIESLMKEKNELDIYKQELTDNLYQANNK